VAQQYSVTYQTIGDGCRRRLGLHDISNLYELLAAWAKGDARPLLRQLKEHSVDAAHADIDAFFAAIPSGVSSHREPLLISAPREETETVSFRLSATDARLLRVLAELERSSVGEVAARMVALSVREQIKVAAQELLQA